MTERSFLLLYIVTYPGGALEEVFNRGLHALTFGFSSIVSLFGFESSHPIVRMAVCFFLSLTVRRGDCLMIGGATGSDVDG